MKWNIDCMALTPKAIHLPLGYREREGVRMSKNILLLDIVTD